MASTTAGSSVGSGNARPSGNRTAIQFPGSLGTLILSVLLSLMVATGCSSQPTGAGKITFGSQINDQTLELIGGEKATFTTSDTFAWRAVLSQSAGASSLRLVIAKKNGSTEVTQTDEQLSVSNPDFNVFGNELPMSTLATSLDGPGTYVMRVLREGTKLAEGEFTLR